MLDFLSEAAMEWIVTDNIYQETWRRILEFANVELTVDQISKLHGAPASGSERQNYMKQARQVRASVLQAREYFDAAYASTVYTSANHAYYGMVSLASAIMLVRGKGEKSLDVLRRNTRNNHHGLVFQTGATASTAAIGLHLLENSRAEILDHGHFVNWHNTLPTKEDVHAFITREVEGGTVTNKDKIGHAELHSTDKLFGSKKSLIELLQYIPDLKSDLQRYGVTIPSSRTTHEVRHLKNGEIRHAWLVHGAQSQQCLNQLLEQFCVDCRNAEKLSFVNTENRLDGIVALNVPPGTQIAFEWPGCRETLNHDSISYAHDFKTMEIVDMYLIAYQLSMLSRYYPDVWISCLESQCRAAKLIERSVGILCKKAPILALSLLVPGGVVISTHREPWKGL